MRRLITLPVAVALVAAAAGTGTAVAADHCVDQPGCTPERTFAGSAGLQAALDAAMAAAGADRVLVGAGTYTAPGAAGFQYGLAGGAQDQSVELVGSGAATVLTAPAGATRVLHVDAGAGSAVSDLGVVIPANAAASSRQLSVLVPTRRVAVTAAASQAHGFTAVGVDGTGTFEDGSVALPGGGETLGVLVSGNGAAVRRSTVTAPKGIAVRAANVVLDRVRVDATSIGVEVSGGARLQSSLVRMTGALGAALFARDQPGVPTAVTVDGVTLVGDGAAHSVGVNVRSFSGQAVEATVSSSVVRGFDHSRSRGVIGSGTASLTMVASNFDPSVDAGWDGGGGQLAPAIGQLEPGANVDVDPQFRGPGDYALAAGSPLVDAGDPAAADGLDLDGGPLLVDGDGDGVVRRDMGAFERAAATPGPDPEPEPDPEPDPDSEPDDPPPGDPVTPGPGPATPVVPSASSPAAGVPAAVMPTLDRTAPTVSGLLVSRRRGTRLRFRIDEPASVRIRLERRRRGRYVRVAVVRATVPRGVRMARLTGRPLRPGRYRVVVTATDAAGNRSLARTIGVRVR